MSELILRVARPIDAAAVHAIYEPIVRETAISFEFEPPSVDEIARRMRTTLERYPWLVAERAGELAGYAYATSFRTQDAYQWSTETSVYIAPEHQRTGTATALYAALIDLLQRQGFHVAWAGVALPNDASGAMHEAFGFVPVGCFEGVGHKQGRWHDVGFWRLALGEEHASPASPPLTVHQLAATDQWPAAIGRPEGW